MDQAFFLRAKKLLGQRQPAPLDHPALLAAIAAQQAATPTARIAARAAPEWGRAVAAQAGCFNRAVAARLVNTAETPLTGIFTTAL